MGINLNAFVKGLASQDPVGHYERAKDFVLRKEAHDAQMDQLNYEKGKRDQVKAAGEAISGIQNYDDYSSANPTSALPPKPVELKVPPPAVSADIQGAPDDGYGVTAESSGQQYAADKAAYDTAAAAAAKIKKYHDYVRESYEKAASKLVNDPVAAEQLRELGKKKAAEAYMTPVLRDFASNMTNEELQKKYLDDLSNDQRNRYEVHAIPGTDNFLGVNRKTGAKQMLTRADLLEHMSQVAYASAGDMQNYLAAQHGMEDRDLKNRQVGAAETTAQAHAKTAETQATKAANDYEINKGELAIKKDQLAINRMTAGASARLLSLQADAAKGDLDAKKAYDALIPEYNAAYQKLVDAQQSGDPKAIAAAKTNFNAYEIKLSNANRKPMQLKEQPGKIGPSFTIKDGLVLNTEGIPIGTVDPTGVMIPSGVTPEQHKKIFSRAEDAGLTAEVKKGPDERLHYIYLTPQGRGFTTLEEAKAAEKGNPSGLSIDAAGEVATAPSALRRGAQPSGVQTSTKQPAARQSALSKPVQTGSSPSPQNALPIADYLSDKVSGYLGGMKARAKQEDEARLQMVQAAINNKLRAGKALTAEELAFAKQYNLNTN